ncbi:UNVERIFIED_CONTAM: hypothetical protein GTU68_004485 [Idotea baltica]|nr:hypothetical protein [Idotea baltica]
MPRLSDTMEEGNIVSWLKNEGDSVSVGDVLAEVETDKATMDLESFHSGTLIYVGIKEGPVPVDGIIAIIGDKSDDVQALLKEAEANKPTPTKEETPAPAPATTASTSAPIVSAPTPVSAPTTAQFSGESKASPLARKMAEMRKTIARRLGESKFTAPHFYLTSEINMDTAIQARKAINEEEGVKVSFNDMIVKASAFALRKNPHINASWHGDKITIHTDVNIGVAVAIDDGLVVPVIRNVDSLSLPMINAQVKALAKKARSKKIQPAEMQGNTFTISNLGMFDIDEFTAIINPPDACILAVGSIVEKPIVKDGQIVIGNLMKVTLSCDHRIVDGVLGAKFLQSLKFVLENPIRMFA